MAHSYLNRLDQMVAFLLLAFLSCGVVLGSTCAEDDSSKIASIFASTHEHDRSCCPIESWLQLMSKSNILNKKTDGIFINVGFNKGYNFANFINAFLPSTNITAKTWYTQLKYMKVGGNANVCGECRDCEFEVSHSVAESSDVENSEYLLFGMELNKDNIDVVQSVFNSFKTKYPQHLKGVKIHLDAGAVTDKVGILEVRKCSPTDEGCAIPDKSLVHRNTSIISKNSEIIQAITLKEWIKTLVRDGLMKYSNGRDEKKIDIVMTDTEGNDALVVIGAEVRF